MREHIFESSSQPVLVIPERYYIWRVFKYHAPGTKHEVACNDRICNCLTVHILNPFFQREARRVIFQSLDMLIASHYDNEHVPELFGLPKKIPMTLVEPIERAEDHDDGQWTSANLGRVHDDEEISERSRHRAAALNGLSE